MCIILLLFAQFVEKNTSHYSNVTVSDMAPQTTGASIVAQAYIKETSKLRDTGRCDGNPPVTEGFPSQKANNTENVPLDDLIIITYLHNSLGKGVLWWAVCPCVARDVHLMFAPAWSTCWTVLVRGALAVVVKYSPHLLLFLVRAEVGTSQNFAVKNVHGIYSW